MVCLPIVIHCQYFNASSWVLSFRLSTISFTLCVIWSVIVCISDVIVCSIFYFLYLINKLLYFIHCIYGIHVTAYNLSVCCIFVGCAHFIKVVDFMFIAIIFFIRYLVVYFFALFIFYTLLFIHNQLSIFIIINFVIILVILTIFIIWIWCVIFIFISFFFIFFIFFFFIFGYLRFPLKIGFLLGSRGCLSLCTISSMHFMTSSSIDNSAQWYYPCMCFPMCKDMK